MSAYDEPRQYILCYTIAAFGATRCEGCSAGATWLQPLPAQDTLEAVRRRVDAIATRPAERSPKRGCGGCTTPRAARTARVARLAADVHEMLGELGPVDPHHDPVAAHERRGFEHAFRRWDWACMGCGRKDWGETPPASPDCDSTRIFVRGGSGAMEDRILSSPAPAFETHEPGGDPGDGTERRPMEADGGRVEQGAWSGRSSRANGSAGVTRR